MMTASKAFIALCLLALIGTVLVIGPAELRRMLPDGTSTVAAKPEAKGEAKRADVAADVRADAKASIPPGTKADEPKPDAAKLAAVAPPAPAPAPAAEPKAGALAEAQKQIAALPDLTPTAPPAVADNGPRFDVARVDQQGEAAVIAGRAAPGATVELLKDGKPLETVTADAAGQFVMTPPRLPAGSYELTLRSRAPDGTVATSSRTMPVTVAEAPPPAARPVPVAKQEPKPAEKSEDRADVVAALAMPRSSPASAAARPKSVVATKPGLMARATGGPALASASRTDAGGSRVISRGDSLWALSRLAYGDGARYAVIFNANRDKIHDPNLIYPGQTFVLPQKAD